MLLNIKGIKARLLIFAAFFAIFSAAILSGCAPRGATYERTGTSLFRDALPAPRTDAAPPAAESLSSPRVGTDTRETVVRGNDQRSTRVVPAVEPASVPDWEPRDIILGPPQYVASPGAEVVFVAGVRDHGGFLRTNQPVEWNISKESVGHFVRLEGRQWQNLLVGDFTLPRIESDTHALSTTSRAEQVLDRGTARTDDDIRVLKGQTWISVSSPREGITWLTASGKNIKDWEKRTQTARIFWVDAVFKLPESRVIDFGGRYTMVTSLRRGSDGKPLSGWRVRYEIPAASTAVFPDGNKMLEVFTDAAGEARLDILQRISRQEDTDVSVQIIRPAETGTAFTQPVVVQQGKVRYRWMPNTLAVQKSLPARAHVGETVMGTISVTNVTDQPLRNIRISEPLTDGFALVESVPKAVPAVDGASWAVETLGPRETHVIQVSYRVQRPGTYVSTVRAMMEKLGNELTVESAVTISAGDPNSPYVPPSVLQTEEGSAGVEDPFIRAGAPTKAFPPPPLGNETPPAGGYRATAVEEPRTDALAPPPAVTPAAVPGEGLPAESAVPRAAVFPEEPADSLLALDINAGAYVRQGEYLPVNFLITNRAGKPLEKVNIRVQTSPGMDNEIEQDCTRTARVLGDLEPGIQIPFGLPLKAVMAGEQTITVTLYNQADNIIYTRNVTVRVLAAGETAPWLPAVSGTAAVADTPPVASPVTPPAEAPSARLSIRVEGPAEVRQGISPIFSIRVDNPTPVAYPKLIVQLKTSPEVELHRAAEGLQRPAGAPAFWVCDMSASGGYNYRVQYLCPAPAAEVRNEVSLIQDGRVLEVKPITFRVIADTSQPAAPASPVAAPADAPTDAPADDFLTLPRQPDITPEREMPDVPGMPDMPEMPFPAAAPGEPGGALPATLPGFPENDPAETDPFSHETPLPGMRETAMRAEVAPESPLKPTPEVSPRTTVGDVLQNEEGEASAVTPEEEKEETPAAPPVPLSVELTASAATAYLGQPFFYTVTMTNNTAAPIRKIMLLVPFPPESLAVRRDGIQSPQGVTVESDEDGMIRFSVIPELPAGQTLTFKIPVRPERAERVEVTAHAVMEGFPRVDQQLETEIRDPAEM